MPREVEEYLRERRVVQSDQWTIGPERIRHGADERKSMSGGRPRNFDEYVVDWC